MTVTGARPGRRLRAVEAVLYAVAYAAIAFLAITAVGFAVALATGDVRVGWLLVEPLLFFGGFALLGYAALKLRPAAPHKLARDSRERAPPESGDAAEDGEGDVAPEAAAARPETGTVRTAETRLEAAVARLPPLRDHELLADDRIDPYAKQLLAAVLLIVSSGVVHELFVA